MSIAVKRLVFSCLLLVLGSADSSAAVRGPTCGVESLWVCGRAAGYDFSLTRLLKQEFVGNAQGSSVSEIVAAAGSVGLPAEAMSGASVYDLVGSGVPAILHVRASPFSESYDHWVAFLGFRQGKAVVVDGGELLEVSPAKLASQWDGTAVFVGAGSRVHWSIAISIGLIASLFLLVAVARKTGLRYSSPVGGFACGSVLAESFCLVVVAFVGAGAYHVFAPFGFAANRTVVTEVSLRHEQPEIPDARYEDVLAAVKLDRVVLVDARPGASFRSGSIPTAINVPVDQVRNGGQDVEVVVGAEVIIFCQSEKCRYADTVAGWAYRQGAKPSVYRGGVFDWLSRGGHLE